jgi:plasmid maintenance system killer protein
MIVEFLTGELKNLYTGEYMGKPKFNDTVIRQYRKAITLFAASDNFSTLRNFRSLRIHKLEGDLKDKWSASVNMQYRIIFSKKEEKIQILLVEALIDYH